MKKYSISTILGIAVLAFPALAFASSATFSASPNTFNASLGYGSTGTAVIQLQEFLISQECLSVKATGYFGSLTVAGVKCFQTKYGVSNTGYFGAISRAMANQIADISAKPSAYLPAQGIQSSVNLSQGALAPASITPLAGFGSSTIIVNTSTSSYSLSPLVGSGVVTPATTSMSQGANATAPLSPLVGSGPVN